MNYKPAHATNVQRNEAPKHKTAFLIWLAVFPTVLALSAVLSQLPLSMPPTASIFVITALAIPFVVYVVLPNLTRLLAGWLYGDH